MREPNLINMCNFQNPKIKIVYSGKRFAILKSEIDLQTYKKMGTKCLFRFFFDKYHDPNVISGQVHEKYKKKKNS